MPERANKRRARTPLDIDRYYESEQDPPEGFPMYGEEAQ